MRYWYFTKITQSSVILNLVQWISALNIPVITVILFIEIKCNDNDIGVVCMEWILQQARRYNSPLMQLRKYCPVISSSCLNYKKSGIIKILIYLVYYYFTFRVLCVFLTNLLRLQREWCILKVFLCGTEDDDSKSLKRVIHQE